MALTTRQDILLGNQDWQKVYESFRNADFQSYDYQTLRKSMIDYLKIYYPEDFNDFVESSEYIALIDLIAFLGQSLAYRTDLNARENFIDTAERRDSVLKLAKLISYIPKRNQPATGFLKFDSVQTTQTLFDSSGNNITGTIVNWNDDTNSNWYEQFIAVLNAAFTNSKFGNPYNSTTINSILTDEYKINTPISIIPIFTFAAQIDTNNLDFEVVSATTSGKNSIYEATPSNLNGFNILYRNDNRGNSSNNTGFFFYFKQGTLKSENFTVTENIPNNVIPVNFNNINNDDVWLTQTQVDGVTVDVWENTEVVSGQNVIYNNSSSKKIYQITTRNNDQIDLVFGDGSFGEIPEGTFTVYFRTSAGITYTISPDDIQSVLITIPYYSESNRLEQLTVTASLNYTIGNAIARESINEIKTKAPQQYYTQNRMITGEDYNIFPYTKFSSISKVKAVNRTSTGISRYFNPDFTGKYSSTNVIGDDGILYLDRGVKLNFKFGWNTSNDINKVIKNNIIPLLDEKSLMHFYYKNFSRETITNFYWRVVTSDIGSSSGYFVDNSGTVKQVGSNVSGPQSLISIGAVLIFDVTNVTTIGSTATITKTSDGNSLIYTTVVELDGLGSTIRLSNGKGPITLNQDIPTGAELKTIIPAFKNNFSVNLIKEITDNIVDYKEFGLRYNQKTNSWVIVNEQNLNTSNDFSQTYEGNITNQNLDSSWLFRFSVVGSTYSVYVRFLDYYFYSASVKFYFDENDKIFNYDTSKVVKDEIKILKINLNNQSGEQIPNEIIWNIENQKINSDGYRDPSNIVLTFSDTDNDGIPDNPDAFDYLIFNPVADRIFFQVSPTSSDINNQKVINASTFRRFSSYNDIIRLINNFSVGQIVYALDQDKTYEVTLINGNKVLNEITNISTKSGKFRLLFQYKHNASYDKSIDPSSNNIIDLYVMTKDYQTRFRNWVFNDKTIKNRPLQIRSNELLLDYGELNNFKSVSDEIIFNSGIFKLLFGSLANSELQATFKVIKNPTTNISDNEIKNRVLSLINQYFSSEFWDFGETFYFTELATYIQKSLPSLISGILLVPNSTNQSFGSLQQISSNANEILLSCATIDDIEVISSITRSQIYGENSTINTLIT